MLIDKLKELVQRYLDFIKKWTTQIQIPCLRNGQILFCTKKKKKTRSDSAIDFSETDIIKMLEDFVVLI